MMRLCHKLVLTLAAGVFLGCTTQGTPVGQQQALQMAAAGPEATAAAQRQYKDPQTAYRVELLNNQLRHAQLDLQSTTNESERQSIQQRIDVIQHMLDSLQ